MTLSSQPATVPASGPWWGSAAHDAYLRADAERQFAFFAKSLDPKGGFHAQDMDGNPIQGAARELHATTRMVHSFALAHQLGIQGADRMVDHGMQALWALHRDPQHGGYIWSFTEGGGVADGQKLAYGHSFVLLAASSAKIIGHPDADRLIADISEIIDVHFWDHDHGRMKEEYARDWSEISSYRGMNANMHSVEALMAAFEATGEQIYLARAQMILDFFVGKAGAENNWRLPEHFNAQWQVDLDYEGNPMFRPRGSTPGHAMEFARLLLQAWELSGRTETRFTEWSAKLYERALADGWDHQRGGGLVYTTDGQGKVLRDARYWWPVTEAIGAAAAQLKAHPTEKLQADYLMFWQAAEALFIDAARGGWYPEVGDDNRPDGRQFIGKPDIYHAIQGVLYPLLPGLAHPVRDMAKLA